MLNRLYDSESKWFQSWRCKTWAVIKRYKTIYL